MIRAILIDDTEMARVALRSDLNIYCPEIEIVAEAGGVAEGKRVIASYSPDLVFLDIRMGDGTGFDLLDTIPDRSFKVIFTTAYDEYAIKAFRFSALDYLLKPMEPEDLIAAVEKVKNQQDDRILKEQLNVFFQNIRPGGRSNKIALNSLDKIQMVSIDQIIRCESQSNYTLFCLKDRSQLLVTKTLKEFEDMLHTNDFIRVHHSHLINAEYVKEFLKSECILIMADGSRVPVSVRKKEGLMKYFFS